MLVYRKPSGLLSSRFPCEYCILIMWLPVKVKGSFNDLKIQLYDFIDKLRDQGVQFKVIASVLNDKGYLSGKGSPWNSQLVERFYKKRLGVLNYRKGLDDRSYVRVVVNPD